MRNSARTRRIVEGIIACIFVFFLLEGGARIAWTIRNDISRFFKASPEPNWYNYSTNLGWERTPDFSGKAYGKARTFDSRGFVSIDTKQIADTSIPRIVFIGDSTTFGLGVDTNKTFVELLDSKLPDMSAINLGVPGYTSYQGYKTLRDYGLDLKPSIIIVSFNFNDRRYVREKTEIDSDQKFQRVAKNKLLPNNTVQLDQSFNNIYIYRLVRFLLTKTGVLQTQQSPDRRELNEVEAVDLSRLQPRVSPENYRNNLVRMAEIAQERKIPIFFLVMKDNPIQTNASILQPT